jgi:hypothetical protein
MVTSTLLIGTVKSQFNFTLDLLLKVESLENKAPHVITNTVYVTRRKDIFNL